MESNLQKGRQICKWYIWQGISIQNIYKIKHTKLLQPNNTQNNLIKKKLAKNFDISPNTYKWPRSL